MKKVFAVAVGMVFLSIFATGAFAADKLGYVDLSRLFDEYGKTKDYDKVLEEKQTAYEKERTNRVDEVKKVQDKMSLLSDKEKEAKKGDLESKIKSLQDFDRVQATDLRKERDEKMKEILKDIENAVSSYSKANGYTLVFNDRVLVYQDKSMEITDGAMKVLQGYYKK